MDQKNSRHKTLGSSIIIMLVLVACTTLRPTSTLPPFFEEHPAWNMPDLAVTSLAIQPERANPRDLVLLRGRVANQGTGPASASSLVFLIDGREVTRVGVGTLMPGEQVEVRAEWPAGGAGSHMVRAQVELKENAFDRSFANNSRLARVRVAGQANPEAELEFAPIDFDAMAITPGASYPITVGVHNPSFASIAAMPAIFSIDGERISRTTLGPLEPGARLDLTFTWRNVTRGEHLLTLQMELPDRFPFPKAQSVRTWHVIVSDKTVLLDQMEKDEWASRGPRLLNNGWPPGSVGRMDAIAFHPTNSNVMYACSPSGGIWKTNNAGDSWTPQGDKLAWPGCTGVAVDPQNPDVVYATTGHPWFLGGKGIYKSVNGGDTWNLFASEGTETTSSGQNVFPIKGVNKLVLRHTSDFPLLIYAATDHGVLRYTAYDPLATSSKPSEWEMIKSGIVSDIVVNPTDDSLVFVAILHSGVFRTGAGVTMPSSNSEANWTLLGQGLPDLHGPLAWVTLAMPNAGGWLYAGIPNAGTDVKFSVYRTVNQGDDWKEVFASQTDGIYNPFLRTPPGSPGYVIYYGGIKLYKRWAGFGTSASAETQVVGIHDDMHDMQFDPQNPAQYYVLSDGGIFRCTVNANVTQSDTCIHRNTELRVTQFFDLDAATSNSNLMIGGTQDNGTIIYEGQQDWRPIHGGDGLYAVIAPSKNEVMYAQYQSLDSTERSGDGGKSWTKASNGLPKGWVMENSYITVHPLDADYVLSQGPEVYATTNGGLNWTPRGPKGANVKGSVTKVLVQPKTFTWIAGTDQGELWFTATGGSPWFLLSEHPYGVPVQSMAFAPADYRILYVLYRALPPYDYTRVWRYELNPGPPETWTPSNITDDFPINRDAKVIAGDGYSSDSVYIGTDAGMFRGNPTAAGCGSCVWKWHPYNNGLPLVEVKDLLVDPISKQLRAATWGRGIWAVVTGP